MKLASSARGHSCHDVTGRVIGAALARLFSVVSCNRAKTIVKTMQFVMFKRRAAQRTSDENGQRACARYGYRRRDREARPQ